MVDVDKARTFIEHLTNSEKQIRFRINSHDHVAPSGHYLRVYLPGDEPEITEGLQAFARGYMRVEMETINGMTIEFMTPRFEIIGETDRYIELWTTTAIPIARTG